MDYYRKRTRYGRAALRYRQTYIHFHAAKSREGKAVADGYKAQYDSYTDKLTTGIKYLETKKDSLDSKFIKPMAMQSKKCSSWIKM
jgi:hypothetical protein